MNKPTKQKKSARHMLMSVFGELQGCIVLLEEKPKLGPEELKERIEHAKRVAKELEDYILRELDK